jgi:hypothetical protein
VKPYILVLVTLHLFSSLVFAEEMAVELRFDSGPLPQSQALAARVKSLRPVRIQAFDDNRAGQETVLGELRVNGQPVKVLSRTAVSVYATDAFRRVYDEWGGAMSADAPLLLKGEITQFSLDEADGYEAKVGFHFFLRDSDGKVLWDGHSSGVVRGVGRTLTAEALTSMFNGLLRETYTELLEDDKLIGVWSGQVQNTYIIRDSSPSSQPSGGRES